MATQVQFRRGTTAQTALFTGVSGEIVVDTTLNTISVQDGSTQGGTYLAKQIDLTTGLNRVASNTANVSLVANAAYLQANTATTIGSYAYNTANSSLTLSTTALSQSNIALLNANTALSNIIYIKGVDVTQNTNIVVATNLAQAAFDRANTIPTSNSYTNVIILAQAAFNAANSASHYANSVFGGSF